MASYPQSSGGGMIATTREDILERAMRYREALRAYAFSMLRDWVAVEDVLQEAYLVVMEKWETYDEGTNLFAWVRQIVHFKTLTAVKKREKRGTTMDGTLLELIHEGYEENQDENVAERMHVLKGDLKHCMTKLPEERLELVVDFYWERKSCEQLAQKYERTVNAIRLVLTRIRKALAKCVKERNEVG